MTYEPTRIAITHNCLWKPENSLINFLSLSSFLIPRSWLFQDLAIASCLSHMLPLFPAKESQESLWYCEWGWLSLTPTPPQKKKNTHTHTQEVRKCRCVNFVVPCVLYCIFFNNILIHGFCWDSLFPYYQICCQPGKILVFFNLLGNFLFSSDWYCFDKPSIKLALLPLALIQLNN